MPEEWKHRPAKLRQKDRDARWTVKFSKAKAPEDGKKKQRDIAIPAFGYKDHASIDRRHGFIRRFNVTSAAAYDGAQLRNVLDKENTGSKVWADTAYRSKKNEAWLEKNGYVSDTTTRSRGAADERGDFAGQQLALESSLARRARICPTEGADNFFVRTIGIVRARAKIGMANLAYNMQRFAWHEGRRRPSEATPPKSVPPPPRSARTGGNQPMKVLIRRAGRSLLAGIAGTAGR